MFEESDVVLNTESVSSDILTNPSNPLPMQNSYCDHRNFDSVNMAYDSTKHQMFSPKSLVSFSNKSGPIKNVFTEPVVRTVQNSQSYPVYK